MGEDYGGEVGGEEEGDGGDAGDDSVVGSGEFSFHFTFVCDLADIYYREDTDVAGSSGPKGGVELLVLWFIKWTLLWVCLSLV